MVRMMKERKDWMEPVAAGCPTTGVESACRPAEMAVRLSDIVIRRSGLGAAGHQGGRRGRLRSIAATDSAGSEQGAGRNQERRCVLRG
jgi:hypothetical protein